MLTAEQQAALTPEEVLRLLKEGNRRYIGKTITARDHSVHSRIRTAEQHPMAIVLSCVDSRVPVEDIFDRDIGDIFVARVAGNFVNTDILGSMEFACKFAGAKLILVLGHEECGAVKATIDDLKLGNMTAMLAKIKPALDKATGYNGPRNSENDEFVHLICEHNVDINMENIRNHSPVLKEMEEKGEILVTGAVYDMDSGYVVFK